MFTLGYSRRLFTRGYHNERLATLLDGHERALRHFGGVTLNCLYDNPRNLVLGRSENKVLWHPVFEDFARYYGFTPRACQPYRARTKGKVESGVKYVKRNALAGRRFGSWEELNDWLERWSAEIADQRLHDTTHERPLDRFAREQLGLKKGRVPDPIQFMTYPGRSLPRAGRYGRTCVALITPHWTGAGRKQPASNSNQWCSVGALVEGPTANPGSAGTLTKHRSSFKRSRP